MGLVDRLLHREPEEAPCPRCGTPSPAGVDDCTACGWDMREKYSGAAGSHLGAAASLGDREPAG